jgi:hypothetical protein
MRLKIFIDNTNEAQETNNVYYKWVKEPSAHPIKYQIKNNGQANDFTIKAKVELMVSANPEPVHNHSITLN